MQFDCLNIDVVGYILMDVIAEECNADFDRKVAEYTVYHGCCWFWETNIGH